jgi:hypothetical protein
MWQRKIAMLIMLICIASYSQWRVWPEGISCEITFEHQLIPERDTLLVKHWHKVDNRFYVLPLSGGEIWCDNVKELNSGY